jgi:hypothetical protein
MIPRNPDNRQPQISNILEGILDRFLLIKILIDIGVINIAVDCPSYYFVHLFVHTDTVGHVP